MFYDQSNILDSLRQIAESKMDKITAEKDWSYGRFRQVMINLGILGNGVAIPARNRPNSIDIRGIRPFIESLYQKTKGSGVEYGQSILVDREKSELVMGKITAGNEKSVGINTISAPGREGKQASIGSVHVHPEGIVSHGLSVQDYKTFLTDKSHQIMLMTFRRDRYLMAMKTSVTPRQLNENRVEAHLGDIEKDYLYNGRGRVDISSVVAFNKQVCMEFGLVLFTNSIYDGGDKLGRVDVVK